MQHRFWVSEGAVLRLLWEQVCDWLSDPICWYNSRWPALLPKSSCLTLCHKWQDFHYKGSYPKDKRKNNNGAQWMENIYLQICEKLLKLIRVITGFHVTFFLLVVICKVFHILYFLLSVTRVVGHCLLLFVYVVLFLFFFFCPLYPVNKWNQLK